MPGHGECSGRQHPLSRALRGCFPAAGCRIRVSRRAPATGSCFPPSGRSRRRGLWPGRLRYAPGPIRRPHGARQRADRDSHRPGRRPDARRRGHGAAGHLRAPRRGARQPRMGPTTCSCSDPGTGDGCVGSRPARWRVPAGALPGRDRARTVARGTSGVSVGRPGPRPPVRLGTAPRRADGFVTMSCEDRNRRCPGRRGAPRVQWRVITAPTFGCPRKHPQRPPPPP